MVVALRIGLFLNMRGVRREIVWDEETYRHGRTGQHLALGVTEELEDETFLRKYIMSRYIQCLFMNWPNRKRVYPEEKEQRIILELEVSQPVHVLVRTNPPRPSKWLPYTIIQVIISRLELSSSECSDITCSSFKKYRKFWNNKYF